MARKRGSVYRNNGQWYAIVSRGADRLTGQRKRDWHAADPNTRQAAEQLLTEKLRDLDTDQYVEPSRRTLGVYLDEWLLAHRSQIKATTWGGYVQKVRTLIKPRIGNVPLQELDQLTIKVFYQRLLNEGYVLTTVKSVHAILTRAMKDAVAYGYLNRSPVPPAPKTSAAMPTERPTARAWTREQLAQFLASTKGTRLHTAWWLVANTGIRREELCGLTWENVNLDRGLLIVAWIRTNASEHSSNVVEDTPKTSRSRRVVDLDPETVSMLRAWREQQELERAVAGDAWAHGRKDFEKGRNYVLLDEAGTPPNPSSITKAFAKAVKASGLPHRRLHDLRHTHATLLLQAGVDAKVVSERLGHSSVAFTMDRYVEVLPTMQRAAADAFGQLLRPERQ